MNDLLKYVHPREDDGFTAAMKMLQMQEQPDAIFTSNSLLASGVLLAIRKNKLVIPDDIAFVSFDDTSWAK